MKVVKLLLCVFCTLRIYKFIGRDVLQKQRVLILSNFAVLYSLYEYDWHGRLGIVEGKQWRLCGRSWLQISQLGLYGMPTDVRRRSGLVGYINTACRLTDHLHVWDRYTLNNSVFRHQRYIPMKCIDLLSRRVVWINPYRSCHWFWAKRGKIKVTGTSSYAVAERPRNASCLSVVSFNSTTIPRPQSIIISYFEFRFTNAYTNKLVLFCSLRRTSPNLLS